MNEPVFQAPEGVLDSIIQASPIGMLLVDEHQRIVFANQKTLDLFGYDAETLRGLSVESLMPERFRADHPGHMQAYFRDARPRPMAFNRDLKGLTSDGRELDLEIGLAPLELDQRLLVLASIIDVTHRRTLEDLEQHNRELRSAAYRDPLTDLPNRRLFLKEVEDLRDRVIRHDGRIVVLFIDLDGFKAVNDRYGHALGDELLREVAGILGRHVRRSDVISRIGGDEFLVCYADVDDGFDATAAAERLVEAISGIGAIDGHPVTIGASIGGVSTALDERVSLEALVDAADRLMYQAKTRGKARALIEHYRLFPQRDESEAG
jgi:diguanylate cyclase (GGDEF)-like protein/PAS domain S-box-containing protein